MSECMNINGFTTWKTMAIEMMYQGFINRDNKPARIGATMAYILFDFDMWEIDSKDFIAICALVLRVHDIDMFEWDKQRDFITYIGNQLQRVSAICHSTKGLEDYFSEPGGELLRLKFNMVHDSHPEIFEQDMTPNNIINTMKNLLLKKEDEIDGESKSENEEPDGQTT